VAFVSINVKVHSSLRLHRHDKAPLWPAQNITFRAAYKRRVAQPALCVS
jgi:hypothetical protein